MGARMQGGTVPQQPQAPEQLIYDGRWEQVKAVLEGSTGRGTVENCYQVHWHADMGPDTPVCVVQSHGGVLIVLYDHFGIPATAATAWWGPAQ